MRLVFGAPPTSPDFDPAGWTRLRMPGPSLISAVAVPIGLATGGLLIFAWRMLVLFDESIEVSGSGMEFALAVPAFGLIGMVVVLLTHELMHCLGQPYFGMSARSYIGIWPAKLMFYAAYLGAIPRNRYVMMGMLPFMTLSIAPLAACTVFHVPQSVCELLAIVSVFNGFVSCGDLLIVPLLLWQVPANAMIHDHGWEMYWK